MSIAPLQKTAVSAPQTSSLRGAETGGCVRPTTPQRCGTGGPGLQQDGFDLGSPGKAHLGKLLESTLSVMNTLVQVMSQISTQGGAQAPQGLQGTKPGASPFDTSGFASAPASSGRPPLDLNPTPTGAPFLPPPPPSIGGAPSAPPSFASNPLAPTTPSAPTEGTGKLGGNLPPGLEKFRSAIESAAAKTGVPAEMLAAQIWQESRGDLAAVTTNGGNGLKDTGLMQVNPNTFQELQAKHPELAGKDLSDPATNILAGACYMKDMKEQFGGWDLALRAYNSGPNGVDKSNPDAIPAGTGDATYVRKVKDFMSTLASGEGSLPA
ncbi:transglycosylase SLT domain-containing protein [Myxococcus sp. K38C18041901]|uniref:lytic transglycosylase domain-containing protein n=1 Tax=Myxococcus guangdongensis TaxID=2906760 RepID=UPI0020A7AC9E|nr:transglycosylase SLT domain-containing protein [Myxococcus guangdongensis]MCP3063889.1 transglycosylase SLT domain-containing protein [Myxococcus guangdongensis]